MLKKILFILLSAVYASSAFAQVAKVTNIYGQPVQSVVVDNASLGDNTIISAVTGKRICVLGASVVAAGAVIARFESGAGGTALTGQMSLGANGGFVLPQSNDCWFVTAAGALLNLELSDAISVDGVLTYVVID